MQTHAGGQLQPRRVRSCRLLALLALLGVVALVVPHSLSPCLLRAGAALVEGSKHSSGNFVYLERFCFDQSGGAVNLSMIESAQQAGKQQLLFFTDAQSSWHSVYKNDALSCDEKVAVAKAACDSKSGSNSCATSASLYATPEVYAVTARRPKWWYIALANCKDDSGIGLDSYRIHFTNRVGFFSYEFSMDVQGIFQMSITFFVLYSLLLLLLAWIKQHAKAKGMQYTIIKYLFVSVALEWLALLLNLAHYAQFGKDGVGHVGLTSAYFFFDFLSNLVLLDTVLNVCKGWAISTNHIQDRRLGIVIVVLLVILYIVLFAWQQAILDPAAVVYVYELPPGWGIVGVRCALTLLGAYFLYRTYKLETDLPKRQFYMVWSVLALGWLVSLPVIVGVATAVASWARQAIVFGILNSVQALVYLTLTYLFRPFRSNRYVSILNPHETRAFGNNNMQVFPDSGAGVQVEFTNI